MSEKNSIIISFFEVFLFILILLLSIKPIQNYDFWFHLKNGEYIVKTRSLPFTDIFSHSTLGGPTIPYEWLFQVFIFVVFREFGEIGVQIVLLSCVFIYLFLFRLILSQIFKIDWIFRLILVSLLAVSSYIFWVERPQIVAFVLFMTILYLVLARSFINNKKIVWLAVPLILLWSNTHASAIVGLYLLFAFALIGKSRDLWLFAFFSFIVTLLPPLGIKVYELLFYFFDKRQIIASLEEFTPLFKIQLVFFSFIGVILLAVASFAYSWIRSRQKNFHLLFLPLLPLGLFALTAIRQLPFSTPAIGLLFVPFLISARFSLVSPRLRTFSKVALAVLVLAATAGILWYFRQESVGLLRPPPTHALGFIKKYLHGNMFNEYPIGGYLIYHLGPDKKTFIDGRMSQKLSTYKVLPDYYGLIQRAENDQKLISNFYYLVDKYHISWALLSTKPFTIWRRLANMLREEPNWQLVFFDDTDEIYVKNDGKNIDVIKKFAVKGATPFADKLYRKEKRDLARREYQHMLEIAPSSVSANALGYFLLEEKKYYEAKKFFEKALQINPKATSPRMNLAELAAADGNFDRAVSLYREALRDDYERKKGFAYLRLGQFLMQIGQPTEAKKVWEEGIKNSIYKDAKKKMEELLK